MLARLFRKYNVINVIYIEMSKEKDIMPKMDSYKFYALEEYLIETIINKYILDPQYIYDPEANILIISYYR